MAKWKSRRKRDETRDAPASIGLELANREQEVAWFLSRGYSIRMVAQWCCMSVAFVEGVLGTRKEEVGVFYNRSKGEDWGWQRCRVEIEYLPTPAEIREATKRIRKTHESRRADSGLRANSEWVE